MRTLLQDPTLKQKKPNKRKSSELQHLTMADARRALNHFKALPIWYVNDAQSYNHNMNSETEEPSPSYSYTISLWDYINNLHV